MKSTTQIGSIVTLSAMLALGGCANMNSTTPAANVASIRSGNGLVQSVELVQQENTGIAGSGIGVGAVAGAVVGGIVGNQIGAGRGNTIATVAGAAGGAYVGNEIEKRQQQKVYKITIRMNDGAYQTVVQETDPGLRSGDRVRIINGVIRRY